LATLSNGTFIKSPKPLKKNLRKLKKGDKTPQSNNYKKCSLKLAKIYRRIVNIHKNSLHKLTTYLTDNFQYISIENLDVKGMMKNRKLLKSILDVGFFEFKRQLKYKSKLKGNFLNIVDRWFPSSKKCSNCGVKKKKLLLSERTYICNECGLEIDRDLNASINIHNQLPMAYREVKPVEITSLNLKDDLLDLTSIVEAGRKCQTYSKTNFR